MYSDPCLDLFKETKLEISQTKLCMYLFPPTSSYLFSLPNNVINAIRFYANLSVLLLLPLPFVSSLSSGARKIHVRSMSSLRTRDKIRGLFNLLCVNANLLIFIAYF